MKFDFPKLSDSRVSRLSDISADMGQIFFASVFLGPMFSDEINWFIVMAGFACSLFAWLGSLLLIKE